MVNILHFPKEPNMDTWLTNLADELLVQDITEPSTVLGSFSADELQVVYDALLEQFASDF
jgi:hypothetical protein